MRAVWPLLIALASCARDQPEPPPAPSQVASPRAAEPEPERDPDPEASGSSIESAGAPLDMLHRRALREDDPAEAARALEQACGRGFGPSCLALAERLESGDGLPSDPERAARLVEEACMSGSTLACDRMGH